MVIDLGQIDQSDLDDPEGTPVRGALRGRKPIQQRGNGKPHSQGHGILAPLIGGNGVRRYAEGRREGASGHPKALAGCGKGGGGQVVPRIFWQSLSQSCAIIDEISGSPGL